ncbi:MAG: hypothetical protein RIT45_1642 [Pseudomonadota bacterium]
MSSRIGLRGREERLGRGHRLRRAAACVALLLVAAGCGRAPDTGGAAGDGSDTLTGEALLDALWQQEHSDTHAHAGDVDPNHRHDDAMAAGDADGHAHGGAGGHWGTPTGPCAEGTWSTLHPDCIGNSGCTVDAQAAPHCGCGCAMCWQDLCVELACDITPGCPPIDDD